MAAESRRLSVWALALAGGLTWALCMLLFGVFARYLNWGVELHTLISSLYRGSDAGALGILIGTLWGFGDAFTGLLVFGWIYNACVGKPKTES